MTRYSIDPPRRNLIVHHTYDDVELDRVVDHSPQAIDGKVVGDVTFGHTGVLGSAARIKNKGSEVKISAVSDQMPLDELHATSWGRSEREVEATVQNVYATITIDGTQHILQHVSSEETTEWQYASLSYDGDTVELRYAKEDWDEPQVVDTAEDVGQVEDFELTFYTNGYGFVDDTRIYRRALTDEQDANIFTLASEHQLTENYRDAWDNPGIPYFVGENNERLTSTLGEEDSYLYRQMDAIEQSHHINFAAGSQLDKMGGVAGIGRQNNESDEHYRARIIATLAAGRSSGTFEDLLKTTAAILGTSTDRVRIEKQWQSEPISGIATAEIFIRREDISDSTLSVSDITQLLKDAVPGGHDVEVTEQGANPFTVRNDSQANDETLGLTSDSISTGGGLVSDA